MLMQTMAAKRSRASQMAMGQMPHPLGFLKETPLLFERASTRGIMNAVEESKAGAEARRGVRQCVHSGYCGRIGLFKPRAAGVRASSSHMMGDASTVGIVGLWG
jgi:hypothetical protein